MAKRACILTIDIGTSSAQIAAFDFTGKETVYRTGSYPTFHPHPDWSEQDPEQVFITVLFLLKGILNDQEYTRKHDIRAIVLSSSMHSVLAVDRQGNALGNAIIWSDNRACHIANELKHSKMGETIYANCGTPIHAMAPISKIKWIKEQDREKFRKAVKFISLKEYLIFQLTGEYYIDYSLASATGIFNLKDKAWDQTALDFLELDPSYFSTAVEPSFCELKLKEPYLHSLRLDRSVKLIIGSSDGCLESLSSGSMDKKQAVVSVTSSGAVRVFGESIIHDEKGRFFNYILKDGIFISGGPTNNGGVAFEWVARGLAGFDNDFSFEERLMRFQNEAAKVVSGSEGLIFLPYLQGERAPIWNSNARGTFFGLNIIHQPRHIMRAVIEGVAFEMYSIAKSIEEHREVHSLYLNGSYATTPLWSSIICNIFGLPVKVSGYKHSANLGAAMLGLTTLGIFESLEESLTIAQTGIERKPSERDNEVYKRYFSIFQKLTDKLAPEFDEIAKLQNDY
ncbi:MAG: gluconokinase [Cytophagales bacterium]|nr:gluconokinase [Cytophagales bacterium]